jgi:two-component system cell cycle response regulator
MAGYSSGDNQGANGVMGGAEATPPPGGTRVLIVDDDPAGLEMLAVALLDSGFTVRTAASATEALAEARRVPPSLILADVRMPDMDGFQLCATLKEDPELGQIPVVLMSATDGDSADRQRGADVGAAGYLTKPIDLPGLVKVLRHLSTEGS